MYGYIARRILATLPVLGIVAIVVFAILHMSPGDPAALIAGDHATPQQVEEIRAKLRLDRPLHEQFAVWLGNVARGDLGESIFSNQPVTRLLAQRMEPTISLTITTTIVMVLLAVPLHNYGVARGRALAGEVDRLFERVGLQPAHAKKYPHEFSGGQRQRLGIARALALNPRIIIADEPVSALDVSVQAQVINLMMDLQRDYGLSYLFIAHDLAVVQHISHRVAVMYLGRIVELADKRELFATPQHPYTQALLDAVPVPDPGHARPVEVIGGEVPSPIRPPPGCHFHTRCPFAEARCRTEVPTMHEVQPGHFAACHLRSPLSAGAAAA